MTTRNVLIVILLISAVLAGYYVYQNLNAAQGGNAKEKYNLIRVTNPSPGEKIESPLTVEGQARGYWFFEASFPIRLKDEAGNILATGIAQAQGEWMTESFVPFKTILEFQKPTSQKGTLVFEKDNPSGLPENADQMVLPIRFK